jgi:hypothetical protein
MDRLATEGARSACLTARAEDREKDIVAIKGKDLKTAKAKAEKEAVCRLSTDEGRSVGIRREEGINGELSQQKSKGICTNRGGNTGVSGREMLSGEG